MAAVWYPAVGEKVKIRRWRRLPFHKTGKVAALYATVGVEQGYTVQFRDGARTCSRSQLRPI